MKARPRPMAFELGKQLAMIDNRFKLYSDSNGKKFELYDIPADPKESKNLIETFPDEAAALKKRLNEWRASCRNSSAGMDYKP